MLSPVRLCINMTRTIRSHGIKSFSQRSNLSNVWEASASTRYIPCMEQCQWYNCKLTDRLGSLLCTMLQKSSKSSLLPELAAMLPRRIQIYSDDVLSTVNRCAIDSLLTGHTVRLGGAHRTAQSCA